MKTTITFLFILILCFSTSAATRTVTKITDSSDGNCDTDCSLREAIIAAVSGDIIMFDDAVFAQSQTIALTLGELILDKNLTIIGTGAHRLKISRSNSASAFFRIIYNRSASTISNLSISDGFLQSGSGAGIINTNNLTLVNVEVSGNQASIAGGIDNRGQMTVINSAIVENLASQSNFRGEAGGIDNYGSLTLTNCTVSGNTAASNGFSSIAGGIFQRNGSEMTLRNVTIAGNRVVQGTGGGIYIGGSSAITTLGNTIVADNVVDSATDGVDIFGNITSEGFNLIESRVGNISGVATGNILGVDPQLDPNGLAANNGRTRTVALLSSSPAIDKGNRFGSTTDQRGRSRPYDNPSIPNASNGDGSDIGAFEVNNSTSSSNATFGGRITNSNMRGVFSAIVSLTDPIGQTRYAFTNPFGYFAFRNIPAGITYTFRVQNKRFTFPPQDIFIGTNFSDYQSIGTSK